ncbi:MAG: SGNH/GDSL hydrolase family protein [Propionibacteriaceae bacterium]|nr:SGNH/GDSL hydrolase family protein [Propionibacteriaceae bacterium]
MANIKAALDSDEHMTILVLGDATGMDDDTSRETRWVTRWAVELATERPVSVATRLSDGGYETVNRFGSGQAAPLEILNASNNPSRLADVVAQPETLLFDDIDLVILNFGHSEPEADLAANLDKFWAALPPRTMGLVMTQNPQRGDGAQDQRARMDIVRDWAKKNEAPFIDVFGAFVAAPEPLAQLLGPDRINPTDRGSEVWRDAVVAAFK